MAHDLGRRPASASSRRTSVPAKISTSFAESSLRTASSRNRFERDAKSPERRSRRLGWCRGLKKRYKLPRKCDQIGPFLKFCVTNCFTKVAKTFGEFFGAILKNAIFKKNCCGFWGIFLKKLGNFLFQHLVTLHDIGWFSKLTISSKI